MRALRSERIRSPLQRALAAVEREGGQAEVESLMSRPTPPIQTDGERYATEVSFNGVKIPVVNLESEADFAWMESRIVDDGYYESSGIWSFDVDIDKGAVAWMASRMVGESATALDIGSANGPLVSALREFGIDADGIDISSYAIANALPDVADHLVHGSVLDHQFDRTYDLLLAMDVLEHVSPFAVPDYLERIRELLKPNGTALFNIPVWGEDSVWGDIFPLGPCTYHHALPSWQEDHDAGRPYQTIPVDEDGYPVLGHLVWAGTHWWAARFADAGFVRDTRVERSLHDRMDWFFNLTSIARRTFYVLHRSDGGHSSASTIARIEEANPTSVRFPPHPAAENG